MPPVPLIARKSHRYAGRLLAVGESFSARTESDARVLKAVGMAQDAPRAVKPPRPKRPSPPIEEIETPEPVTEPSVSEHSPVVDEPAVEPVTDEAFDMPKRRTYRRRDLVAEDE